MRRFLMVICGVLLLTGCAAPAARPEEASLPPPEQSAAPEERVTAVTIPLADLEPYTPWQGTEPEMVPAGSMGEILCDETLPDGTEVVCYWEPDHLTDPEHRTVKNWAVRRGDSLLRFLQEENAYSDGYGVRAFEDVLGRSGFRIECPRGAGYFAYDYYVPDGDGIPRLLMDCTNNVLEADVNGDGVTELLWDYHGGQFVTCAFMRDGAVYAVELMTLLAEHLSFPALPAGDLDGWQEDGLPVRLLAGGWDAVDEPFHKTFIDGRLRLTPDAAELDIAAAQAPLEAWAGKTYTLIGGAPACRSIPPRSSEPGADQEWTVLGPAIPAPRAWAGGDLAGGDGTSGWAGAEPERIFMQMVSARDGWLLLSAGHGAGEADTYVYRSRDGGVTWREAGALEAHEIPCGAYFFDRLRAIVAIDGTGDTPVFVTLDGGETWREAELPLPDSAHAWKASFIFGSGDRITLEMAGGEPWEEVRLVSRDWGETWELEP